MNIGSLLEAAMRTAPDKQDLDLGFSWLINWVNKLRWFVYPEIHNHIIPMGRIAPHDSLVKYVHLNP